MSRKKYRHIDQFIFFIALFTLSNFAFGYTDDEIRRAINSRGVNEFIRQVGNNLAQSLPQQVDAETLVDGVIISEKTIRFNLHLIRVSNDISKESIEKIKRDIINSRGRMVCSIQTSKILITEYNVDYEYLVFSKTSDFLFKYLINKALCLSFNKN